MKREPATGGRQDRTHARTYTHADKVIATATATVPLPLLLHSAAASHRLGSLGTHVDTLALQQEHGARCSVETDRRDRLLRLFGWKAVRDLARPGAKSTYLTYTSTDTGYIPPTESRPWGLEIGNGPRTTPRCYPFDIHCHRSGPECNGSIDAEIITLNCVTSPADWPLAATPRETPPTSAKTCDGHGSVGSNNVSTPAIALPSHNLSVSQSKSVSILAGQGHPSTRRPPPGGRISCANAVMVT
ncbi:hypothetical protein K456DRAFT_1912441 [Colletotrichum gloeosporioides 23]|nr:hypothetical protein K456DRAFT_1912441 [Colletotrichum gloeosporioides 23]